MTSFNFVEADPLWKDCPTILYLVLKNKKYEALISKLVEMLNVFLKY